MDKALWKAGRDAAEKPEFRDLDWRRKISDHVAYALLAYTGLQIWVTMGALKTSSGSILPYFALIILVAAIIPGCRMIERRWEVLDDEAAIDPALAPLFKRDRLVIWAAAIGLPFVITGLFMALALVI